MFGDFMDRVILHSDCNSFYASVECLHHPELQGKPVAVGGDAQQRRGIILAKNQLAKQYNVQTGEPLWQARGKCPELVVLQPNFPLYSRFSQLARQIYLEYTDYVEPFGLDEAWLDVTEIASRKGVGREIAEEIRYRIKKELGITVSVGVSFNKIFAKLGSDYKKPDAVTVIDRENYKSIVYPLPVSDLLYVGGNTDRKLRSMGITTIGALARCPQNVLELSFGKTGTLLHAYANGEDSSPVALYGCTEPVKSVGNSTTALRDLTSRDEVKIIFTVLADSVSRRMREQGLSGRVVTVGVRDNTLQWQSHQHKLPNYTCASGKICYYALKLFDEFYRWKHPIRGLSVTVSELCDDVPPEQCGFMPDNSRREKSEQLDRTVSLLKKRFGTTSVYPALLLTDKELAGLPSKSENPVSANSTDRK